MGRSFFLFTVVAAAATLCSSKSLGSLHSVEPLIRQVVDDSDFNNLPLQAEHHFFVFKQKFGKSYAIEEEHDQRFKIFKANMRRALRHQSFDPSAIHGVTQLILSAESLPGDFDWRERGAVSCYIIYSYEHLYWIRDLADPARVSVQPVPLKVKQQRIDCDHECDPEEADSCDSGCNGGLMNSALEYTLKVGGLMKEQDYPYYTGTDHGTCNFDSSKTAASVANFSVVSLDEDQIAANLVKNGPLAIAINAVFMQTYIGGVSCPFICSKRLDHGVLLVGYGSDGYAPIRMRGKEYWIIKNSWGQNWGENGYYRICRGRNVCGVDSLVSTVAAVHTPMAAGKGQLMASLSSL